MVWLPLRLGTLPPATCPLTLAMREACLLSFLISRGGRKGKRFRLTCTGGDPPRLKGCLLPRFQTTERFLRKHVELVDFFY